jgi:hypothetical protein
MLCTSIIPIHFIFSMSESSIWASFSRVHCCFWIAGGLVLWLTVWLLTLQLFKNSIDTQEKLRLNLHSLCVSVLLEYKHKKHPYYKASRKIFPEFIVRITFDWKIFFWMQGMKLQIFITTHASSSMLET